jgi:hypothetical protein
VTDNDGLSKIADLIVATDNFARVDFGIALPGPDPEQNPVPWCWVYPLKWDTEDMPGDPPQPRERTVDFEILIVTVGGTTLTPIDLAAAIETAVHGQHLGDTCTSCYCEAGRYGKFGGAKHPQHRLTLVGSFSYLLS